MPYLKIRSVFHQSNRLTFFGLLLISQRLPYNHKLIGGPYLKILKINFLSTTINRLVTISRAAAFSTRFRLGIVITYLPRYRKLRTFLGIIDTKKTYRKITTELNYLGLKLI